MKPCKFILALFMSCALASGARAATMTQNFNSSWTVAPWEYGGSVSALQWQYLNYLPWDSSLGTLLSVSISTEVSGTRSAADTLALRYAFFTGWSPNQYQFYDATEIAAGATSFAASRNFTSGTDFALGNFLSYLYLPQAFYYFESKSDSAHGIEANTKLVYEYASKSNVSEPQTNLLILVALIGLAIAVRRQSPL